MRLNLESAVRFNREPEQVGLYSWSLLEISASGDKPSHGVIPWDSTVRFVASGLQYYNDYSLSQTIRADETVAIERHISTALVATLWFDAKYSSASRWLPTKLSMLGTEREVSNISLRIQPLGREDESEKCVLWGCPSYTTDIDFRDHTFPDLLQIQLAVAPSKFRELSDLAALPTPITLSVTLSRVSGFYSDWSPEISTDRVKILTDIDSHFVDGAPAAEPVLPRLGKVGEFTLSVIQYAAIHTPKPAPMSDDEGPEVDAPSAIIAVTSPEVDALHRLLREVSTTRRAVASATTPIWIAVVLLGLLLLLR